MTPRAPDLSSAPRFARARRIRFEHCDPAGIVFFYGCALLLIGVAAACFLDRRHGGVADPGKPR